MAFQTGSQINPALGRIDYTPYAQGAMMGAQSIGQGIANLGQGIASGIEQYQKQKKENKMMEAQLKANINSLEGLGAISSSLSPQAQEVFNGTMSKLNDPSTPLVEKLALSQSAQKTVGELLNFGIQEREKQQQMIATNAAYIAAQQGGELPLVLSPEVRAQAIPQMLAMRQQRAEIGKTQAQALAAVAQSPQEIIYPTPQGARAAGVAANPDAQVLVEPAKGGYTFKAQQSLPQQVVNPEDKLRIETFGEEVKTLLQAGQTARQLAPQVNTLLNGLETGKLKTGKLEDLKLEARSLGKVLGVGVDEDALANSETAKAMFGRMILEYFQQTKGSISNAENQLFASFGPELGKSEKANKAILQVAQKRMSLDRSQEKIVRDFAAGKIDRVKAQTSIQDNLDKYDQEIAGLIPNQGVSQPAAAGGGINLSPAALQFIPR
jgi:hypothetical protein